MPTTADEADPLKRNASGRWFWAGGRIEESHLGYLESRTAVVTATASADFFSTDARQPAPEPMAQDMA